MQFRTQGAYELDQESYLKSKSAECHFCRIMRKDDDIHLQNFFQFFDNWSNVVNERKQKLISVPFSFQIIINFLIERAE